MGGSFVGLATTRGTFLDRPPHTEVQPIPGSRAGAGLGIAAAFGWEGPLYAGLRNKVRAGFQRAAPIEQAPAPGEELATGAIRQREEVGLHITAPQLLGL